LTAATLAISSLSMAQPASAQDEAAIEREYEQVVAEHQQAVAEHERAALEREAALEQQRVRAAAERDIARERAVERELASRLARTKAVSAAETANLQRELSRAREELARAVGDVARASAQIREPRYQDVERSFRFFAGNRSALGLNIEDTDLGVLVRGVSPNGPAAAVGITAGDTVVSINDVELARGASDGSSPSPSAVLLAEVGKVVPGDEVKLRLLRDGDYRDVVVQTADNTLRLPYVFSSEQAKWPAAWGPFRRYGPWSDIELATLTPALGEYFGIARGLLVVRAGQASELGFRDGDVIIDLAGREPQSPEHALRILASFEPGESLQAAIMRQRRREALEVRVPTTGAAEF
jgi:C-terminal processing protease CtpA/Prc